jgi:DNA-binding response OmpR family regulator
MRLPASVPTLLEERQFAARFGRMDGVTAPHVLVAHRRAPVLRLLLTNLEAEGYAVATAATTAACLAAFIASPPDAAVIDAELLRGEAPECAALLRLLLRRRPRILLVSWDTADRRLARTLHDAPFLGRPEEIDAVLAKVRELVGERARV